MAIAAASIIQETNTFSPVKTRYEDLSPVYGPSVLARHEGTLTELGGFLNVLQGKRLEVTPVAAAWAVTAGRVVRADFDRLVSEFLLRLGRVKKLEGVFLALHGSQAAEGIDDVEGFLLTQIRKRIGPEIPVVVTLDLHANVTNEMVQQATAILGYHTYPHVDMFEVGKKGGTLLLQILSGRYRPTMAFSKLPLIVPAENMQTTHGPMHALMRGAERFESKGTAGAVSIFGVQPWLDVREMGCSVVVVTDNNSRSARTIAESLAKDFWRRRRDFDAKLMPVEKAIRKALKIKGGPVVLAESSDSTGSGSPGDSTGVLKHLVAMQVKKPAAIFLVDPEAVRQAFEAGIGSTKRMRIGGKLDRRHSKPVLVTGRVRLLSDGRWTPRCRGYNPGIETSMGRAVVLEAGSVQILIAERATMTVDPELYRSHSIDPEQMKIVVVKSPNGFRAGYEPIAKAMFVVDTPGVSTANLRSLAYRRVPRPIYPLDLRARMR